jgi:hypothetical protein
MNIFKDHAFQGVILFGLFVYISAILLPYRETLIPLMAIGNMVFMSILTIALVVSSIKFPKYTIMGVLTQPLKSVKSWNHNPAI